MYSLKSIARFVNFSVEYSSMPTLSVFETEKGLINTPVLKNIFILEQKDLNFYRVLDYNGIAII